MVSEAEILAHSLLAVGSLPGVRLSRNNCGAAIDRTGRLVRYGLFNPGGSDVIGWRVVTITPEMVGQNVAVFLAIEFKKPGGAIRPEQKNFIAAVQNAGGISGIARSPSDALRLIGAVDA